VRLCGCRVFKIIVTPQLEEVFYVATFDRLKGLVNSVIVVYNFDNPIVCRKYLLIG
jgi:hypothetical protein